MSRESSPNACEADQRLPVNRLRLWVCFVAGMIFMYIISCLCGLNFAAVESSQNPIATDANDHIILDSSSCDVSREMRKISAAGKSIRYRVRVTRIVDGDTIKVDWHGKNMSLRLLGIDAPESKQPGGVESTAFLASLIDVGEYIDIEFERGYFETDSYSRLLAYLWRDQVLVNVEMVKAGHARLYKNGKGRHQPKFQSALSLSQGKLPVSSYS